MTDRPSSSAQLPPLPLPAQAPPVLPPPPTGSFKLKLKLTAPPPVAGPAPARPAGHVETDGQEDQLASSNDSLSSPPPQPPHPQKRTKSKDPTSTIRLVKKRKSAAPVANPPAEREPGPVPTHPADHIDGLHTGADSDLSSYTSELPPSKPSKPKKPKQTPAASQPPKQRLRVVNMAPLTDAELLTAAATTSQPIEPAPLEPGPVKKKKKKSSGFGPPKKSGKKIASATASAIAPPLNEQVQVNNELIQVEPKPLILTIKAPTGGKSKGKKPSKLQAQQSVPDPFTTSPFPPPQPRMQHNYDLGPPPPPPVPAFRSAPVGTMPRSQGPFLPAQTLDKRTPQVRSWTKIKREVVGVSGIPFWIWTYAGDEHSNYLLAKQNKQANVPIGTTTTPLSNSTIHHQQPQPYFPQHPGSTSSKPSPIRHASGRTKYANSTTTEPSTANLGGPNLPASFRSRSLLAGGGSPLTTDVTSFSTTSPLISRAKRDWDHQQEEKISSSSRSIVPSSDIGGHHHQTLSKNKTGSVSSSNGGVGVGVGLGGSVNVLNDENGTVSSPPGVIKLPELSIPPNGS